MAKNVLANNIGKVVSNCFFSPSSSFNHGLHAIIRGPLDSIPSQNSVFSAPNSIIEQSKLLFHKVAVSGLMEFTSLARMGVPLWELSPNGGGLVLNQQEYFNMFRNGFAQRPVGFTVEASRECAVVMMNADKIVKVFMELVGLLWNIS